jgi:protoporphyrinogen oxidase
VTLRVVVLGGGLTGLVAAERLAAAGIAATVVERDSEPGGACRSLRCGEFTFDYTGHLLHVGRDETASYLESLGAWSQLKVWERKAAIVVGDHITPYPIQIHTHRLAPDVRRDCLVGFIRAWAVHEKASDPATFREWVLARFGDGLARHFFFPYNRKLYRAEPEELSLDWVGRYVPKPDLEDVVDGALGLYTDRVGYNAIFRYPHNGGIRALPDAVAARVDDLRLQSEVVAIDLAASTVQLASGEELGWDALVATASLPRVIDLIRDDLPAEVRSARRALRWVRVLNLALGVEGPAPRDEHWLYFPDPSLPFYRIGFPSNHGVVAPDGCHTVSVEVSLDPEAGDVEHLARACEEALVARGWLDPQRIRVRHVTVMDPAYVVFDHPRKQAVATLRAFLAGRGVVLAGRWAEWKYSAMEDAVLDGMAVARRLAKRTETGR